MSDGIRAETISVKGFEGAELEAFFAQPLDGSERGGVVVIHHMPGYDEPTKEITLKLAMHGYLAICPNLYSRETTPGMAPDDAAAIARANGGVPDERLVGDVAGCADFLRSLPASNKKVGTIGYCSGGRQSFLAGCSLDLQAVVVCYGAFMVRTPPKEFPSKAGPVAHLAGSLSGPMLGLFGAEDSFPTPEETKELEDILDKAGKEYEFHTYEGAGHAFFATDRPSYRPEAAKDGWQRIFAFYGKYLA